MASNKGELKTQKVIPPLETETRFAVVMYGGVSLAIYIYGVTKELYSMVKATARLRVGMENGPETYLINESELSGTEKIYRNIGEKLGTKFVVDILSGTSAGGINAIYLAKALVNGESVELLKDIWLEQGDIGKLINDRTSAVSGIKLEDPPASLLNSQRMYYYLLKALHEMDQGDRIESPDNLSPFVDELDLNITATDIKGLTVDLPVFNAHVQEYKYRNVFRFHYSTNDAAGREFETSKKGGEKDYFSNDFISDNNPFLAYAARCTSSFPFAFEPMRLSDIKDVLRTRDFERFYKYAPETWSDFYYDYTKSGDEFPKRSFGDGGYIDNKPFSYATEVLLRRRADHPIDRKLIYIDPSPEHPQIDFEHSEKPDAIQNVMAALMSIPRYEPIREDLEKVIERNRLIHRVNETISNVDFVPGSKKEVKDWQKDPKKWANKYFDKELIDWFGISYATYHQLRVMDVIENLKAAFLRVFNWEETGVEADDLYSLLLGWRHAYYSIDPKQSETHWSENDILFRLDTTWRMRRISFLHNIINQILKAVYLVDDGTKLDEKKKTFERADQILKAGGIQSGLSGFKDKEALKNELSKIKRELNDAYGYLRARGRKVRSKKLMDEKQTDAHLNDFVNELAKLKAILGAKAGNNGTKRLNLLAKEARENMRTKAEPSPSLVAVFEQVENATSSLAEHLPNPKRKGYVCQTLSFASHKIKTALGVKPKTSNVKDRRTPIQKCLWHYLDTFEYYDMLIFPIYYGTDVGESDEVEIIRVSPEDATSLVNETGAKGKKKLAGTTLANFGAFFAKEWRENDMLWGRLDGAECILKAMLPEGTERDGFIHDLQVAILQEDMVAQDEAAIYNAKNKTERAEREKELLGKYSARYGLKEGEKKNLLSALTRLSEPEALHKHFKDNYEIDRSFPPKETLDAGSRALRVVGNLLNGLSSTHKNFSTPAKWLTSAGSIFAGITSAILPNSIGNYLVAGYWVWLVYVFEMLMIGTGLLVNSDGMLQLGVTLFAATFITHLFINFTNNLLAKKPGWTRFPILLLAGILGFGLLVFILFLLYVGLLDIGLLSLPSGPIGDWLGKIILANTIN